MSLKIVTGQGTTDHVTSADAGSMHAGIVGTGRYVLNLGNKFAYEVISNNLVKVKDGDLMNQGRHMRIEPNDYEECTIENGLQSVKRNDLIVVRYSRNTETQIESSTMVVIKGTSGDTAVDPSYTVGNILNGDTVDDFPLYRVRLNGLNVEGIDTLFSINNSLEGKVDNEDIISTITDYTNVSSTGKAVDIMLEKSLQNRVYRKIGKNLLDISTFSPMGFPVQGITATLNGDKSVTLSGTASGTNYTSETITPNVITLKSGSYKLSGCLASGSATKWWMSILSGSTVIATDYGSGADFTLTQDTNCSVVIYVKTGVSISGTFYPQICYADAENPLVYEQYAPSNAELNSNLSKKPTCELALSSLGLALVIDSMPTSEQWKAVPVSSDYGYGASSIVIGISVDGLQTEFLNRNLMFEITTYDGVLSIIPRDPSMYGKSYAMILARVN